MCFKPVDEGCCLLKFGEKLAAIKKEVSLCSFLFFFPPISFILMSFLFYLKLNLALVQNKAALYCVSLASLVPYDMEFSCLMHFLMLYTVTLLLDLTSFELGLFVLDRVLYSLCF